MLTNSITCISLKWIDMHDLLGCKTKCLWLYDLSCVKSTNRLNFALVWSFKGKLRVSAPSNQGAFPNAIDNSDGRLAIAVHQNDKDQMAMRQKLGLKLNVFFSYYY